MAYLDKIQNPEDLKKLSITQLKEVASEIRTVMLDKISKVGGHVGPNFGIVETAIALHYVFESPKDKIVWDVSHQSIPHKLLTGRLDLFKNFHIQDGCSPFTNITESPHDHFNVGHTSTSVSLACGIAYARDFRKQNYKVIAVLGDGSLSGGEALEGLNIAGYLKSNFILLINDNEFSIDPNAGGLYGNLQALRTSNGQSPVNLFKAFGFEYYYVKDGNDVQQVIDALNIAKDIQKPVVIHVHNKKGKGLPYAEQHTELWHYRVSPFDPVTGETADLNKNDSDSTIDFILANPDVVAVVPGTPLFGRTLQQKCPERYIDVGIAEQSAVAVASGLAASGVKAYICAASSFIQRAYDQIMQDWTMNNTPATLLVFGGGIYTSDYSHVSMYDIAMLSNIPNLVYLSPTCDAEYKMMLEFSKKAQFPIAIRVCQDDESEIDKRKIPPLEYQLNTVKQPKSLLKNTTAVYPNISFMLKPEIYQQGHDIVIVGLGKFFKKAVNVARIVKEKFGCEVTVINPRSITNVNFLFLSGALAIKSDWQLLVTIEDGIVDGGFGQKFFAHYASQKERVVLNFGAKKEYTDFIPYDALMERYNLDDSSIADKIIERFKKL